MSICILLTSLVLANSFLKICTDELKLLFVYNTCKYSLYLHFWSSANRFVFFLRSDCMYLFHSLCSEMLPVIFVWFVPQNFVSLGKRLVMHFCCFRLLSFDLSADILTIIKICFATFFVYHELNYSINIIIFYLY